MHKTKIVLTFSISDFVGQQVVCCVELAQHQFLQNYLPFVQPLCFGTLCMGRRAKAGIKEGGRDPIQPHVPAIGHSDLLPRLDRFADLGKSQIHPYKTNQFPTTTSTNPNLFSLNFAFCTSGQKWFTNRAVPEQSSLKHDNRMHYITLHSTIK